ncbi:PRC-barrel domain protein [Anaerohalosphaera lusitana]|uniref:PRC-barrel domain protein n=1 Tax=Anaerohalosphaera lusitana TaxID=1936003 RepID=A0A1U9NQT7_9BACT|nr:PRC-barrel domain protein [Anaerohalosphaera lusitana]
MLWMLAAVLISTSAGLQAAEHEGEMGLEQDKQQKQKQEQMNQKWTQEQQQQIGELMSANKLIGKEVQDKSGQNVGEIQEVVINGTDNSVKYVIVSTDQGLVPAPWSAFQKTAEGEPCQVKMQKSELRNAPTIQEVTPAEVSSESLKQEVKSFYGETQTQQKSWQQEQQQQQKEQQKPWQREDQQSEYEWKLDGSGTSMHEKAKSEKSKWQEKSKDQTTEWDKKSWDKAKSEWDKDQQSMKQQSSWQQTAKSEPEKLYMLTSLIGYNVNQPDGQQLGQLEDVIVEQQQGKVAYGFVSYGGFWGIGEEMAAVPWTSLELQSENNVALLDVDQETLKMAQIEEDQIQKLSDKQFAQNIHEEFGQPQWEVFGFVPGEDEKTAAWKEGSEYNKSYKADEVKTIKGTVKSVGTFMPDRKAEPGLRLKVETDQGESVTVYCGPKSHCQKKNVSFGSGDEVTITGSKTKVDGKTVIMASEIKKDGQTLQLRDEQGQPQWQIEGQTDTDQMMQQETIDMQSEQEMELEEEGDVREGGTYSR